ncbi:c-type cytochrome [Thaumasiovibrio sp. DFM-14]|uniref:c-type cytochrome n=1 Tax=Thaumasiovibrio sp. DFM-14 TaxID=3384792 RepID=UPI0039A33F4D
MELTIRQIFFSIITVLLFFSAAHAADMSDSAIAKRIKPVGSVYLEGDAPVEAVAAEPRSGDQVYATFCVACHGAGIAGAPATGDAAAWEPRIAQGIDTMTEHAINGFNAMPAMGTCMNCSDDEIVAAINHMIDAL